jgi:Fe-S cluster biogenesis protein NfuA
MNDPATAQRIRAVLDELRPFFTADGGDVEFVECTPEGVVRVRMVGACQGCPSSHNTLQNGLLIALREALPAVRGVEPV